MGINLGDKVKDSITGFEGIAIAITDWLHGCRRITVQPEKLTAEGNVRESQTFDEPQLIIVKAKEPKRQPVFTGGPQPEPTKHTNPNKD